MIVKLNRFCDRLNWVVGWIAVMFLVVLVSCCVLQVFTRYVLNNSFSWTEELARFAFIWCSMLGATICTYRSSHAVVTVILNSLPEPIHKVVKLFITLCVTSASYVLVRYGWTVSVMSAQQRTPALKLSIRYIYLAACTAGVIILIYCVAQLIEQVRDLFRKKEAE
jgi:TRAP-type C4-dicarboxylate transport system permease small subunit